MAKPKVPSSNKTIAIIVVVVILVGAYLSFSSKKTQPVKTSTESTQSSPIPTQGIVNGMKTYHNYPHAFQMKYPEKYVIMKNTDFHDVVFFDSAAEKDAYDACLPQSGEKCKDYQLTLRFISETKPKDKRVEAYLKENRENPATFKAVTIGGLPALQRQESNGQNVTYIDRGDRVTILIATVSKNPNESNALYQNLLSSLTFTDY